MSNAATSTQNYGRDFAVVSTSTGPDIDFAHLAAGVDVLANSLYCRLTTPHGSVIDSPNDCLDLRALLGAGLTQADMQSVQQRVQRECERDARVLGASVTATYNQASRVLSLVIRVATAQGPFSMTLSVSDLTVALITASAK